MAFQLDIDENEHIALMMKKLDNMRNERRHSDLTIKVGNEEFPVHRNIMSAGSDYFDAMLSHDNLETKTGIVNMKEVDVDSVKLCIDYIYTGKASITLEKCEQLLHVASLMQLSVLCEKIAQFLKSQLNSKTFYVVKQIAKTLNNKKLNTICDEYALTNMGAICMEEEFNHLEIKYISFLIGSKNTEYSEDSKLAVLLQWIKADVENRKKDFIELMKLINMNRVTCEYATYLVENESLCLEFPDCMKMLFMKMALKFGVKGASANISKVFSNNALLVFDKNSSKIKSFQVGKSDFIEVQSMHESMRGNVEYTAVLVEKFLYVFMKNRKVYRITLGQTDAGWDEMAAQLHDHGKFLRAAVCNDSIYVCGEGSLERYSPVNNIWSVVESTNFIYINCSMVECLGDIYILGGWKSGVGSLSSVNRYSPSASWASVKSMNVARQTPAAVSHEGKIYVLGGWGNTSLSSFEYFDPKMNIWTNLSPMKVPRYGCNLCSVSGCLYVVGDEDYNANSIEKYDFDTNEWKVIFDLSGLKFAPLATVAYSVS